MLPRQFFGFIRGRLCSDCHSILHTDIIISNEKKSKLGALSIDLEGAYDTVDLEVLVKI